MEDFSVVFTFTPK